MNDLKLMKTDGTKNDIWLRKHPSLFFIPILPNRF